MKRSVWILAVVTVAFSPEEVANAQGRPPNIVVIVADDMGYGDIGVYGSRDIPTPNVDALAAGGVRFTDGYVSGPYCSPTRAGLMTGRYPQRFGHEFNIGIMSAHADAGLPLEEKTIADRLKAAGYRTALFGKWHLGRANQFFPTRRGFDEFFGFVTAAHAYVNATPDANPIFDGDKIVPKVSYLTDTLADRAVEFIKRNKARPFFLYLAFNAVHVPLQATDKYLTRFPGITNQTRRTYAAMLSAMDDGIGRALTALKTENLEENTLIFFFSDNGGPLGEAAWNGSSNLPLRGGKTQTWEGGIRVPFIIRWKNHLAEGKVDSRPIIQLDVLPTALAAAGVPVQPQWKLDGVNLLPFLTGAASGAPHDALYWRLGGIMAVRKGDWKLVKMYPGGADDFPGTINLDDVALFNLKEDIGEKNNLAAKFPDKARDLGGTWQNWARELARPLWPSPASVRTYRRVCTAGASPPEQLASYAGSWSGRINFPAGEEVAWTWVQRADSAGTIQVGRVATPVPTRVVIASSDSIVFDATQPIRLPRAGNVDVMLRMVAQVCGNEIEGILMRQPSKEDAGRVQLRGTAPFVGRRGQ